MNRLCVHSLLSLVLTMYEFPITWRDSPSARRTKEPSSEQLLADSKNEPFQRIRSYSGRNLQKLAADETRQLLKDLTQLVPKRTYREVLDFVPWYLWAFRQEGQPPRYMLFEVRTTFTPGSSDVRLTEFGERGNLLLESTFDTGWRCYLSSVNLATLASGHDPIIVVGTYSWPSDDARISARQYYAKIGDRFDLIRLEDVQGEAIRNRYSWKGTRHGPAVPEQSAATWESDLESKDPLKVLRALVWLGGVHWTLREDSAPHPQREDRGGILLVREVRQRAKVVTRLRALAGDKDCWVREAARLALNPEDK